MQTPTEALAALKAGNTRFLTAVNGAEALSIKPDTTAMSGAQHPFAIILGCSDSRVPAELVFDQGFGQLFVVRVAGNIVGPSQLGSVEFAVETFGTPLVVVMGHSNCGAIAATINAVQNSNVTIPVNLLPIVEPIRPAVEPLASLKSVDNDALMTQAIQVNVSNAVSQLTTGSDAISKKLATDKLMVVGAVYSLETGVVEFIDNSE